MMLLSFCILLPLSPSFPLFLSLSIKLENILYCCPQKGRLITLVPLLNLGSLYRKWSLMFSMPSTCSPLSPSVGLGPNWLSSQVTTNQYFPPNLPQSLYFRDIMEADGIELKVIDLLVEVSLVLSIWWKPVEAFSPVKLCVVTVYFLIFHVVCRIVFAVWVCLSCSASVSFFLYTYCM